MRRRQFVTRSLCLAAAPFINVGRTRLFGAEKESYSVRAIDLVNESLVADTLGFLTLDWNLLERWRCSEGAFGDADFKDLQASGIDVFYPAVAFDTDDRSYQTAWQWLDAWNQFIAQYPQHFVRVDTTADFARAKQSGKIGIILGMQDANYIRTIEDVDAFYGLGQRIMQLTYNDGNLLGSGCMAADGGLTEFGQAVVARMNALGMAIDVSHCGERTSLDAIAASTKPVLVTHSNCRALAPSAARCKSDDVIRAAAQHGSLIGLTSVRHFVRDKDPVSIDDVLDHFDHVANLVGVEHIAIGSDTDLQGRDHKSTAPMKYDIAGLNHPRRMYELTDGLIRRGYSNQDIALMLGGNFQRVLGNIWLS